MDDVHQLFATITGYQDAAVVTAAWRLGLFEVLDHEHRSVEDLAERLEVRGAGALSALLDVLVELGLVVLGPAGYRAAGSIAAELTGRDGLGHVIAKEAVFARHWLELDRVVRDGEPLLAPWSQRLRDDPEGCLAFLEALDVLADRTGPDLAAIPALAPGRRVLDVGGGLGAVARSLAEAGSSVTLVDLPQVASWASARLADLGEQVTVVAADVVTDPVAGGEPASYDAAVVSHLLHDLGDEQAGQVLRHAVAAVRPGGQVLVNEFAAEVGPAGFGRRFDVMMRLETGARARQMPELVTLLVGAGLQEVRRLPYPDPLTVLRGTVPQEPTGQGGRP